MGLKHNAHTPLKLEGNRDALSQGAPPSTPHGALQMGLKEEKSTSRPSSQPSPDAYDIKSAAELICVLSVSILPTLLPTTQNRLWANRTEAYASNPGVCKFL